MPKYNFTGQEQPPEEVRLPKYDFSKPPASVLPEKPASPEPVKPVDMWQASSPAQAKIPTSTSDMWQASRPMQQISNATPQPIQPSEYNIYPGIVKPPKPPDTVTGAAPKAKEIIENLKLKKIIPDVADTGPMKASPIFPLKFEPSPAYDLKAGTDRKMSPLFPAGIKPLEIKPPEYALKPVASRMPLPKRETIDIKKVAKKTGNLISIAAKSLAAKTADVQTNFLSLAKLIHRGSAELTALLLPDSVYNVENDPVVQKFDKAMDWQAAQAQKLGKPLENLKGVENFIAMGVGAIPQVVASVLLAYAFVPAAFGSGASALAPTAKTVVQSFAKNYPNIARMLPFGAQAAGGSALRAEQEGANYTQQVAAGVLTGMGEMATEALPLEYALRAIKAIGADNLVEAGAKNFLAKYKVAGLNYLKALVAESLEEVAMEPIEGSIRKSIYAPETPWTGEGGVVHPKGMIEAGYGGLAMSVMLGALGLPAVSASYIRANKAIENNETSPEVLQEIAVTLNKDLAEIETKLEKGEDPNVVWQSAEEIREQMKSFRESQRLEAERQAAAVAESQKAIEVAERDAAAKRSEEMAGRVAKLMEAEGINVQPSIIATTPIAQTPLTPTTSPVAAGKVAGEEVMPREAIPEAIAPVAERREDFSLRAEIDKLSPEEKDEVIKDLRERYFRDELTGLKNRAAYLTDEKQPFQAVADLDNLKWINDNIGHGAGDTLIKTFADTLPKNAYHISGDEFVIQGRTKEELIATLTEVENRLNEQVIELVGDKRTVAKKGIGFSYGIGETSDKAETVLQQHKKARLAEGERVERGEAPKGLTEIPTVPPAPAAPAMPATEIPTAEPPAAITPEAPPVDTAPAEGVKAPATEVQKELEAIRDALVAKRPNASTAEVALKKIEALGIETDEAKEALDEYKEIERVDYEDAEEYRDEKKDAWDTFIDRINELEIDSEATPKAEAIPKAAVPALKIPAETVAKENYRIPLSEYTDNLYHETNIENALRLSDPGIMADMTHDNIYFSNDPTLALGQGKNKGVLIEFKAGEIQGSVNKQKPSWEMLYGQGKAEFIGRLNDQKAYRDAVKSITVKPDVKGSKADNMRMENLVKGWESVKNEDGSTTYYKPEVKAEKPKVETETGDMGKAQISEPKDLAPIATGKIVTAKTERGTTIEVQYAIVEANTLTASHDVALKENPAYPSELQPRDRTRAASEIQINRMVSKLEPEFLGDSPKVSEGAPIVGKDGIVESGNARTIALQRLYDQGHKNADTYKEWLMKNAEKFGIDKKSLENSNNPVLVRVRQTDIDRVKFTQEANEQAVASMSASEQAQADAKKLTGKLLAMFSPSEAGEILTATNRQFISSFLSDVVGEAERGKYLTKDGSISQDGAGRIRNAVFARAYGDTGAIEKLAESTDVNVKNQINAMLMAAPRMVRLKDAMSKGELHDLDISEELVAAMNKLSTLRESGQSVDNYLRQISLVEDLSPLAKDILDMFDKHKRSTKKVTSILQAYADAVEMAGDPRQETLFIGDKVPTKAEALERAVKKVEGLDQEQITLFQSQGMGGTRTGTPGEKAPAEVEKPKTALDKIKAEMGAEVDRVIGEVNLPIGQTVRIVNGSPKAKGTFSSADPEIDARVKASHGIKSPGTFSKIKELMDAISRKASREYEHLPRTGEFAPYRFELLKLSKQRGVAADDTLRLIQGIIIDFKDNAKAYNHFEWKVLLNDLAEESKADRELPFGYTEEKLKTDLKRLDEALADYPEVVSAVEKRKKVWDSIVNSYVEAQEAIGLKVEGKFNKQDYFRHMVLDYANERSPYGTGTKLKTPAGRGFLRQREGSKLDINTNYLEAEYEVMAQMLYDIEVAKVIKFVDDNGSITKNIKAEYKAKLERLMEKLGHTKEQLLYGMKKNDIPMVAYENTLKSKIRELDPNALQKAGLEDWHNLIPEGYTVWQPREGNTFYFADTIPSQLAQKLFGEGLKEIGVSEKDIRKVLAKGQKFPEMVIKEELALTLDNLTKDRQIDPIRQVLRGIMKGWKIYTLTSPKRWAKYNARNISGDAEAVFLGNPSTFLKVPQAAKELYRVFAGDAAMTKDMRDWFEMGGMQSLLQAQEIGDVNNLRMFVNLMEKKGKITEIPTRIWQGYWKAARLSTDYREAVLRYAAYLDFLEKDKKLNGKIKNFAASVPEEVMALRTAEDRSYWLANDLVGAYDRVSVIGQELRESLIPFWSFQEVNFKRYLQFIKNAARDDKAAEMVGRIALGTLKRSPLIALRVGMFLIKAVAFWAMLDTYNKKRYPEEELELPANVRNTPHIVLGRDKDGKVIYFSRLGILSDFLEWFGLEEFPALTGDFLNGKKNLKEIVAGMAKGPINKLVQSVGPQYKMPAELIMGKKIFPDAFNPGMIRDRPYYIAQSLGLADEYSALMKLPRKPYSETLKTFLIYTQDPGQGAYYDILDMKREFQKEIGKPSGFMSEVSPKSQALYNLKLAVRYQDKEAFDRYAAEYISYGGKGDGLTTSLRNMHPLHGLKDAEKKEFVKRLNEDDRKRLDLAIMFYEETLLGQKKN